MNLKEIAAVPGVTERRVCQLHNQGIARLREWRVAGPLRHSCRVKGFSPSFASGAGWRPHRSDAHSFQ